MTSGRSSLGNWSRTGWVTATVAAVVVGTLVSASPAFASAPRADKGVSRTYPLTIHDTGTVSDDYAGGGITYHVDFTWDESRSVTIKLPAGAVPKVTEGPLTLTAAGSATSTGKPDHGGPNDACNYAAAANPPKLVGVQSVNATGETRTVTFDISIPSSSTTSANSGTGTNSPLTASGLCTLDSSDGPLAYLFHHPSSLNQVSGEKSASIAKVAAITNLDLDQLARKPLQRTFPIDYTETDTFGGTDHFVQTEALTVSVAKQRTEPCAVASGSAAAARSSVPLVLAAATQKASDTEIVWTNKPGNQGATKRETITDKQNTVIVGQHLALVDQCPKEAPGAWSVTAVNPFRPTADASAVAAFDLDTGETTAVDLANGFKLELAFVRPGTFTVTADDGSARTTFVVKAPTAEAETRTCGVGVNSIYSYKTESPPWFGLGWNDDYQNPPQCPLVAEMGKGRPGIQWHFTVKAPAGVPGGTVTMVQVISVSATHNGKQCYAITNQADVAPKYHGHDVGLSAGQSAAWEERDSPVTALPKLTGVVGADSFHRDFDAHDFLMYQPDIAGNQTIWVPLGDTEWSYKGTAELQGFDRKWRIVKGSVTNPPLRPDFATPERLLPTWNGNAAGETC